MKMPKKQIERWCHELWSGKWKQGQSQLERENRYCCLGVACKTFHPNVKLGSTGLPEYLLSGGRPLVSLWLREVSTDFYRKTEKDLPQLNDDEDFTFPEIADLLYAVYVLGVLDEEGQ